MNYSDIETALVTQLKTAIGCHNLQEENTVIQTTAKSPVFYRATLLPSQTTVASIGINGSDTLNGLFQIDVFTQKNTGTVNKQVDDILEVFNRPVILTSNEVEVQIINKWRESARVSDNFYIVPVIIQWSSHQYL